MPRGFRFTVDLNSSATALTCLSCREAREVDGDDQGVVLAATTATFLAAHQWCEQPVLT